MSGLLPSIENFAKNAQATVAAAAGLGTVGVGLLFFGQNYLIYPSAFPPGSRTEVPTPIEFGLQYEPQELITPDEVKLRCYLLAQKKDLSNLGGPAVDIPEQSDEEYASTRPTVMMFHGNGGNIGHRIPLAKVFYVKMRCNVFMLSYRGYGHSEGTPSEKGIQTDAQCALDFIHKHPYLRKTPIILYGQSIGGAVSIDLASRNPKAIRALILENTFLSLPRLVPSAFPVLGPFSFLCHQKWDSASKVSLIPGDIPILMLSGVRDEVVPHEHMRDLWDIVQRRTLAGKGAESGIKQDGRHVHEARGRGGYSKFVEFDKGTHNDTCVQPGYWSNVAQFIEGLH
ncbi:alpha/beta-hydrolase [Daedalea quercina L-15889]|uniref:Alpha/beta-hydrolase n=1 Tax=Daedalea quercina L-15889 TaxID=1314783 RepID=A0A165LNY6_9APHY|nr:alpha/beta-hydrolase [Daedalea quercina L-15889]